MQELSGTRAKDECEVRWRVVALKHSMLVVRVREGAHNESQHEKGDNTEEVRRRGSASVRRSMSA